MKIKKQKDWKNLNIAFTKWWNSSGRPDWLKQRNWLSKELVKRSFIKEDQLPEMWVIFHKLTNNCSLWKTQNKILFLIILCLNDEIGESLGSFIK